MQIKCAKDLLIKVCRFNNKLVEAITDFNYIAEDDIKEIEDDWTNDECKEVLRKLSVVLKEEEGNRSDYHVHPWCILHNFDNLTNHFVCNQCGYGERNSICSRRGSVYSRIVKELAKKKIDSVEGVPGLTALIKAIIEPFY